MTEQKEAPLHLGRFRPWERVVLQFQAKKRNVVLIHLSWGEGEHGRLQVEAQAGWPLAFQLPPFVQGKVQGHFSQDGQRYAFSLDALA